MRTMTSEREIDFGDFSGNGISEKVTVYEDQHGDIAYYEKPIMVASYVFSNAKLERIYSNFFFVIVSTCSLFLTLRTSAFKNSKIFSAKYRKF